MSEPLSTNAWRSSRLRLDAATLALALLAGIAAFVACAWVGWLLGVGLHGGWALLLALLAVMAVMRFCGQPWRASGMAAGFVLAWGAVFSGLAGLIYDLSFDGMQYHQQAILLMSQGWNPLTQPESPLANDLARWVDGYAKTHWVYAALLADLGAGFQSGKSFNWLLALAAALLVQSLLTERLAWRPRSASVVTATAVLSPVVACQWQSFLNDQTLACTIVLTLAAMAWAVGAPEGRQRRQAGALVVLALALLASAKASGVAYAGLFIMAALPLVLWGAGLTVAWRIGMLAATGLAVGVLLLGFNPYVTNMLRHGHPFHPLAGPGKVDIISNNAPPDVLQHSRAVKLFGSLAARSSSVIGGPSLTPPTLAPKVPGSVSLGELKPFLSKNDVRIGGFGPWFGLALLLSWLGLAWTWLRRRRSAWHRGLLVLPTGLLLLSALAFPEPWWARYVPQVWLVPLVAAVAMISLGQREADVAMRRWGWSIVGIAAVNAAAVALLFVAGSIPRQLDVRAQLASLWQLSQAQVLTVQFGLGPAAAIMFDDAGIRWTQAAGPADCAADAAWVRVEYTFAEVCLNARQRDSFRIDESWKAWLKARF